MELAARQILRALRGKRSQVGLSRRLRYRGNPAANWETGRRFPTARETLRICKVVGVDVQGAFERFVPAAVANRSVRDDLHGWLTDLSGTTSITAIAERSGRSRFAVARWLSGKSEPRLPDFLRLVEAITGRASDLVAELVSIELVPSLEPGYRARQAARGIAFDEPWTEVVLRVLETPAACEHATLDWIARQIPLDVAVVERCIAALQRADLVVQEGQRFRAVGSLTVDTKGSIQMMRRLTAHWSSVALERMQAAPSDDLFAYNVFSVSETDLERIRSALRASFRETRAIVAGTPSNEVVALLNLQLLRFGGSRAKQ